MVILLNGDDADVLTRDVIKEFTKRHKAVTYEK